MSQVSPKPNLFLVVPGVVVGGLLLLTVIRTLSADASRANALATYEELSALCRSADTSQRAIDACKQRCELVPASEARSCREVSGLTIALKRAYPKK